MPRSVFSRYDLRTTDLAGARAFYEQLFGPGFWSEDVRLTPLPEQAIARGAPAHWLGYIGVEDVEAIAGQIVAAGGMRRGPTLVDDDGIRRAALSDPFGAGVGVASGLGDVFADVAAHLHHSNDPEAASVYYANLFGWSIAEVDATPADMGRHLGFSYGGDGAPVGRFTDAARLPQVHHQWQYFFPTGDIDTAVALVKAGGGIALPIVNLLDGTRVVACDDPQGAAFGLVQRRG
ncbi:MAG: hypothetical protein R2834_12465 [Rhodothermales bacterium]